MDVESKNDKSTSKYAKRLEETHQKLCINMGKENNSPENTFYRLN